MGTRSAILELRWSSVDKGQHSNRPEHVVKREPQTMRLDQGMVEVAIWLTKRAELYGCRLPQFSDLSWLSPFGLAPWLSPFGLAPLTTCAQVDKSERKLRDFAQVRVILAGAP